MLLGKRPRQHMRRTTSMTGITVDPPNMDYALEQAHDQNAVRDLHAGVGVGVEVGGGGDPQEGLLNDYYDNNMNRNLMMTSSSNGFYDNNTFLASMVSPRNHQRLSTGGVGGDHSFVETAHFLRTCGLCKRRLAPGKDIYMYRGDTAFCSLECREQQMKQDERKEKFCVMASSKKDDRRAAASSSTTTRSSSSSSSSSSSNSSSSTKSGAVAAT